MQIYMFTDGTQPVRYLVDVNGLRPAKIYFRIKNIVAEAPFVRKEDNVIFLVVLHGCTTARPTDIVAMLEKLNRLDVFQEIIVYTNIPLPACSVPYTIYQNDIFSGEEVHVPANVQIQENSLQIDKMIKKVANPLIYKLCTDPQYKAKTTRVVSKPYVAPPTEVSSTTDITQLRAVNIFKKM